MKQQVLSINIMIWLAIPLTLHAQREFTVEQCVEYAFANNPLIRAYNTEQAIAELDVKRVGGLYLPRAGVGASFQYYLANRKMLVEGGSPLAPPSLDAGAPLAFDIGYNNSWYPTLGVNQLIYDPAYRETHNIAEQNQQLSGQQRALFKIDVIAGIHKAFFTCKILDLQAKFLRGNISRIDTLIELTRIKYQEGAGVKLEVNRVEVTGNRMRSEFGNVLNRYNEALMALQFQMNYLEPDSMILQSTITAPQLVANADTIMRLLLESSPDSRIESQSLQTQIAVADELVGKERARMLPVVGAEGVLGFAPAANNIGDIFQSERWKPYSYIGINVGVPIFNGMDVKRAVEQGQLQASQFRDYLSQFTIQFQNEKVTTYIAIKNFKERLAYADTNLRLAQDNVALLNEAFINGVADNQDMILGENDLYDNQSRYFNELLNLMLNEIDGRQVIGFFNGMATN
ncbi:MAG TPA: TolC family protein [Saprospiraceae bacterium]|nr:TolC family protein [Saprospiraceae bacterium]